MFKFLAAIVIFFLGGCDPKGHPKTVVQRKKIARIEKAAVAYRRSLFEVEQLHAELVEEFGVDHEIAEQWAESAIRQSDLQENMERGVAEAIKKLQDEIDQLEATTC